MRIWDVDPGYLNRGNLLGEHAEAHAAFTVLAEGRKGYSRHPETLRWQGRLAALAARHDRLVAEMTLRGYNHRSPMAFQPPVEWPATYVDAPARQFELLAVKYREREPGRIPIPDHVQVLWAQHKYSVMARDPDRAHEIGAKVADHGYGIPDLSMELVRWLRRPVSPGGLRNALEHMWGYVNQWADCDQPDSPRELLDCVRRLVVEHQVDYLLYATALAEFGCWVDLKPEAS